MNIHEFEAKQLFADADIPVQEQRVAETVDEALVGTGWEAVVAHQPRHRVAKRGFELVLASD